MLICILSNGDRQSSSYISAENQFFHNLKHVTKKGQIPDDTDVKFLAGPTINIPNPNDKNNTEAYLFAFLNQAGVVWGANFSWKAELYKEFGYTFLVYYITGDISH